MKNGSSLRSAVRQAYSKSVGGMIRGTLAVLGVFALVAVLAGFVAPYDPQAQDRETIKAPPTPIHWFDAKGRFHFRPFICSGQAGRERDEPCGEQGRKIYPLGFFVRREEVLTPASVRSSIHLFGLIGDQRAGAPRLHLLGTDHLGRDTFSRLIYGSRISLSIGVMTFAASLFIGLLVGGLSGYYSRVVDALLMRLAELVQSVPALLLVLALRAALPLEVSPAQTFLLIVLVLAVVAWPEIARIVRGTVLSIMNRDFILSARALGEADHCVIIRHVIPHAITPALVQATVLVPSYILAEAALSFLGLGVREPDPSWGNMLAPAMDLDVLIHQPWMLAPGAAIFLLVLTFNFLADALRERLDPQLQSRIAF